MTRLLQCAGQLVGCLLVGSALMHAQGIQGTVTLQFEGTAADVAVAFLAAGGQKTPASAIGSHEYTLAADLMDPNKQVEVFEVVCDNGTAIYILAPGAQLPPGCKSRRRLGTFIWKSGARFVHKNGMSGAKKTTLASTAAGGVFVALATLRGGEDKPPTEVERRLEQRPEIVVQQNTALEGTFNETLNLVAGGSCNQSWRNPALVRLVVSGTEVLLVHVNPTGEVTFRHVGIARTVDRITGTGSLTMGPTVYTSDVQIVVSGSGTSSGIASVRQTIRYRNASGQSCEIGYAR